LARNPVAVPISLFKMTFGPDGAGYISQRDGRILRYDGTSLTTFVSDHLQIPLGLSFGPEGDLYVADYRASAIVRFQGPGGAQPGAYLGVFASTGQSPNDLVIVAPEPTGMLVAAIGAALIALRRGRGRTLACCAALVAAGVVTNPARAGVVIEISDFSGGRVIQTDGVTKTTLVSGLNQPMGIALGANGDLYVANYVGGNIAHFRGPGAANAGSFAGTFATGFGIRGTSSSCRNPRRQGCWQSQRPRCGHAAGATGGESTFATIAGRVTRCQWRVPVPDARDVHATGTRFGQAVNEPPSSSCNNSVAPLSACLAAQ
jgi:hypothetical protein